MRISIIATVLLVLLGGALGYYVGTQQRHVEPDAYGLASRKIAFSNRYDCEVIALSAEQADAHDEAHDEAMGAALLAQHPELDAPAPSPGSPAGAPTGPGQAGIPTAEPECEPMTFAQVHAAGFVLVPRETPRDSGGNSSN